MSESKNDQSFLNNVAKIDARVNTITPSSNIQSTNRLVGMSSLELEMVRSKEIKTERDKLLKGIFNSDYGGIERKAQLYGMMTDEERAVVMEGRENGDELQKELDETLSMLIARNKAYEERLEIKQKIVSPGLEEVKTTFGSELAKPRQEGLLSKLRNSIFKKK